MDLREIPSRRFPGLAAVVNLADGHVVNGWIAETCPEGVDTPLLQRLQCGISGKLIEPAMELAPKQPEEDSVDDLFALRIFNLVLEPNKCAAIFKIRELREEALKKRKQRLAGIPALRAEASPIIEPSAAELLDEAADIERLAWARFFPGLPFHDTVDIKTKEMQDLKVAVLPEIFKNIDEENPDEVLSTLLAGPRHSKDPVTTRRYQLTLNWIAYSIHRIPDLIGQAALAIIEEAGFPLTPHAIRNMRICFGADPLFGGTSLHFLRNSVPGKSEFRIAIDNILNECMSTDPASERADAYQTAKLKLSLLLYLDFDVENLDRIRNKWQIDRGINIKTGKPKPDEPPEAVQLTEQLTQLNDMVKELVEPDRIILLEYFHGHKPREIANSHPEMAMSPKQISDRLRYLIKILRARAVPNE